MRLFNIFVITVQYPLNQKHVTQAKTRKWTLLFFYFPWNVTTTGVELPLTGADAEYSRESQYLLNWVFEGNST